MRLKIAERMRSTCYGRAVMSALPKNLLMGRSLVSFEATISATLRDDVMNCLLYAQLSADTKYDRKRNWRRWVEQYQRVIYQKGGLISGAINPVRLDIRHLRELRHLPYRLAGGATSPTLQALLEASIMQLMDGEHAQAFFGSWFTTGRSESMQVIPCQASGSTGASIMVCGLHMTTRALAQGSWFWEILSGVMTVRANGASFTLTEQNYAPFRQQIADYLDTQAQQAIIQL